MNGDRNGGFVQPVDSFVQKIRQGHRRIQFSEHDMGISPTHVQVGQDDLSSAFRKRQRKVAETTLLPTPPFPDATEMSVAMVPAVSFVGEVPRSLESVEEKALLRTPESSCLHVTDT